MTSTSTELLNKLSAILGLPSESLTPQTTIRELPEWDSLAQLAIMSTLEKDYGISWNPNLFLNINSIGDILNIINFSTHTAPLSTGNVEHNNSLKQHRRVNDNVGASLYSKEEHDILKCIAENIGINISELSTQRSLTDIPEWDSLSLLAVVCSLNEIYKVSLKAEDLLKLNTIGDIISVVQGHASPHKAEEQLIVYEPTITADFSPIVYNILHIADITPTRTAIIFPCFSITYRQLANGILSTASLLTKNNIKKGQIIALFAEKKPEFFYCYFAAHYIGAINLILDPNINTEKLNYIIRETQPALFIGKNRQCTLSFSDILLYRQEFASSKPDLSPSDIADIIFTTGTTGAPKGVPLSHENLIATVQQINKFTELLPSDIEVLALPIYHSFGLGRARCTLYIGATLVCVDGFSNTKELFLALSENKATGFAFVPAAWSYLKQTTGILISRYAHNLRYIEIGSAPMPQESKEELMLLFPTCRICMHYGLTEASRSSFIEFHSEAAYLHTAGRPSPNTQIAIFKDDGTILAAEQEGEICIKGKHVMSSYLNTPDSHNYYHEDYFRTGDWGKIDKFGYLHILSRTKDIINSGGKKISPIEVENALLSVSGIKECACVAAKDPNGILGEIVKAFLVSDGLPRPTLKDIRFALVDKLENYKLPSIIEWIDSLPKTESGKIKRNEFRVER